MRRTRNLNLGLPAILLLIAALVCTAWACAGSRPAKARLDRNWYLDDAQQREATEAGRVVRSSLYLTMRDGVRIAVDVYLPANLEPGEKLPTLLNQTRYLRHLELYPPYNELLMPPEEILQIVGLGYAVVRVDARGSGASFGTRPCPWSADEVTDGAQVVDWIIEQPWSNGLVGAVGGSYEGTAAEMLLVNRHPAVKAAAPMYALYDAYADIAFPGGIHLWWFTQIWQRGNLAMDANDLSQAAWFAPLFTSGVSPVDDDHDRVLLEQAVAEHATNYHVHEEAAQIFYRDDVSNGGLHIDSFSPHHYLGQIAESEAAIYNYSGWFDGGYAHSAIKRYLTMGQRPQDRLILGPWDHGGDDHVRQFQRPYRSNFDHMAELARFFDYHLKGIDTGIYDEQPVHYYTMGEDTWHAADTWPPPEAQPVALYLRADGTLDFAPPDQVQSVEYAVDPKAGTGGYARWNSLALGMAVRYPDRRKADRRLLVFQSAPLDQTLEVTGHPLVHLYISSSKTDADVFIYLEDVDPAGRVGYVSEGMLRASHRKLCDEPLYTTPAPCHSFLRADAIPLEPGEPTELIFDLQPTSYLFKRGHSLRIAVAGADADHFRPLPGDPSLLTVHTAPKLASRIVLPLIVRDE
ncbi:MAG: CocE/NonD family hydrolase [Candidatus Alcyoniella australis]|nr:CocE/NonD family hydrolase [Candidatus Alcyoniella australis]